MSFTSLMFIVGCDRCKKESCSDNYAPISPEFKSYCVFPVGSFWVYENPVTTERDTVTMVSFESEVASSSQNNDECTETGSMTMNSTYRGNLQLAISTDKYSSTDWQNRLVLFASNGSGPIRFLLPDNDFMMQYDTLTINEVLYNNVYVFESTIVGSGDPIFTEVFVKNIGVVYRQLANGDEFHLIEHHIN
jgi:hypothetical protein